MLHGLAPTQLLYPFWHLPSPPTALAYAHKTSAYWMCYDFFPGVPNCCRFLCLENTCLIFRFGKLTPKLIKTPAFEVSGIWSYPGSMDSAFLRSLLALTLKALSLFMFYLSSPNQVENVLKLALDLVLFIFVFQAININRQLTNNE